MGTCKNQLIGKIFRTKMIISICKLLCNNRANKKQVIEDL